MRGPNEIGLVSWRGAWLLIVGLGVIRALYLALICPYELAADEAQYWDWSRRLDLSYYSKGPGIAWLIAGSTRLLGDAEWAIRLPAVVVTGVTMWAAASLASRSLGGTDRRRGAAAFYAAAAFVCIPAYHATAMLMTIDAPYIACWALAALAAWRIRERAVAGRSTIGAWAALAAALGVGFLFKYTILLLIPGLVVWALSDRLRPRVTPGAIGRATAALVVFCAVVSPVVIWNQHHGWPTLSHLLGHIGAPGGDLPRRGAAWSFNPMWPIEFIGSQIGMIGPMLILMVLGVRVAWRARAKDPSGWEAARFSLCAAAPILLFYLGVSFVSDAEGNWPIAGYVTLLVPVALAAASRRAAREGAEPQESGARSFSRAMWRFSVGFGVVSGVGVMSLNRLDRVPVLTEVIPYHRLSGQRERAAEIDAAIRGVRERMGAEPFIIAHQYTRAALAAYYLSGRPPVRSAASFLGGRKSSYDFFDDTSLRDPALLGRPAILIGSEPERWSGAFRFGGIEVLLPDAPRRPRVYLGLDYQGPASP